MGSDGEKMSRSELTEGAKRAASFMTKAGTSDRATMASRAPARRAASPSKGHHSARTAFRSAERRPSEPRRAEPHKTATKWLRIRPASQVRDEAKERLVGF